MSSIREQLIAAKAVAILRGDYTKTIDVVMESLLAGGVYAIEITLNSTNALELIGYAKQKYGAQALIGAGTVLDSDQVKQVADVGGQFIVAPDTFNEVILTSLRLELEPLPGVYTATEARTAMRAGAKLLKLFPATSGGAEYLKQLRAPLDDALFFPTGGISAENAADYIRAGAAGIGAGSWLVPKNFDGSPHAAAALTERAKALITAINNA